jgi:hypothetical protein
MLLYERNRYIDLVKQVRFTIEDKQLSKPFLWWSRADLGLWKTPPDGYKILKPVEKH